MVYGLPAPDEWADLFVQGQQLIFRDVDADPELDEQFAVRFLGRLVDVVLLAQNALVLLKAAIADIRRLQELATKLFREVGADLITQAAGRALASALRLLYAQVAFPAVRPHDAAVPDAVRCPFFADNGSRSDFPRDRRGVLAYL